MPTYEYEVKEGKGCPQCRKGFDYVQRMSEPALEKCPQCGAAVVRRITACAVNTQMSEKAKMSSKNLKRLGFTKLVKEGQGRYRKTT